MKIRAPSFEVDEADPFKFDVLRRKVIAETLTELIRTADDALVIGVDAGWGQGKTTFLRMWQQHLIGIDLDAIYFSAWESDFSGDGFVSILGEIEIGMEKLRVKDSAPARKSFARVKKVSAGIVRRALPAAVKIATAGMLDMNEIAEDVLSEAGQKYAEERIEEYEKSKKSISGFKSNLEKFVQDMAQGKDLKTHPLIIIIDELDRCKPSYAIDVLESIKHLFSVRGVVFVVAADWTQLANIVRARYGLGVDADAYMRRFIDISFSLPPPGKDEFIRAQFDRFELSEYFKNRQGGGARYDRDQLLDVFSYLFRACGCSLRDQERCFTLLGLAVRTTPQGFKLHSPLLAALIVLKVKSPDLYRRYLTNEAGYREVLDYFELSVIGKSYFGDSMGYSSVVEAYLATSVSDCFRDDDCVRSYMERADNEGLSQKERARAKRVQEILTSFEFRDSEGAFSYVAKKIDFLGERN